MKVDQKIPVRVKEGFKVASIPELVRDNPIALARYLLEQSGSAFEITASLMPDPDGPQQHIRIVIETTLEDESGGDA